MQRFSGVITFVGIAATFNWRKFMTEARALRPWLAGLTAGIATLVGFVLFSFLLFQSFSSAAAGVVAMMSASGAFRRASGQEFFPHELGVRLGVVALTVYTFALFTGGVPLETGERFAMLVVFAIPAALLLTTLRRKPQQS